MNVLATIRAGGVTVQVERIARERDGRTVDVVRVYDADGGVEDLAAFLPESGLLAPTLPTLVGLCDASQHLPEQVSTSAPWGGFGPVPIAEGLGPDARTAA